MCDGEVDCGTADSSDEDPALCTTNSSCPTGQTACRDQTRLPTRLHCDNKVDCRDNSDEGPFCELDSGCAGLNCSHQCRMTWTGPRCICPEGKQPAGTLCVDANECAIDGTCDQLCTNHPGTYLCGCVPGYRLVPPSQCRAINTPLGKPPSLLVSTTEVVEEIEFNGKAIKRTAASDSSAIDFDHRNGSFCWIAHRHNVTPTLPASVMMCSNIEMTETWRLPDPDLLSFSSVNQIAYDWAAYNWYYLDESKESIFMCRVKRDKQICKVVVNTKNSKPRGIALDPCAGK